MTTPFTQWNLRPELKTGLAQLGFENPTPVQEQAFPLVMGGRDLLVQSRTGTGKTLAFGLPLLERLNANDAIAALVVLPTRELAQQVATALGKLARPLGMDVAAVYGGGSYRDQHQLLKRGATIVVGTPGRLCDHIDRGSLNLSNCQALVLDEADELLDMGFADELDKILGALPAERQSLLFSATMAPETRALADKTLKNPETLALSNGQSTATTIRHVAYEVFRENREDALLNVLHAEQPELAIIFCHTKAETETLAERLSSEGFAAAFLHGDLPQASRTKTLNAFRRRETRMLVATDVAARGIDVKNVSHVINLAVPYNPETYVHRVGRTGRAGASGTAVTFVAPRDAARFRRMLQGAGAQLELLPLPQADDVRKKLRERFHEVATAGVAAGAGEPWRALAEELLGYVEPTDLVTFLLSRDNGARGVVEAGLDVPVPKLKARYEKTASERPARPVRDREERGPRDANKMSGNPADKKRKLSEHKEAGMTRVWLNMGKSHQMGPGRLVQLVCSSSGLKGDSIGAIAIHPHFCFFDVKSGQADHVVDTLNGMSAQGRKLKANLVTDGQKV